MKKYKYGIFSWFGYVIPVAERLTMIKEAGFDAVSIWWEDEIYPNLVTKEEIVDFTNKLGLYIENIHCPDNYSNDLWNLNDEVRNKATSYFIKCINSCASYDIPIMVMHVTNQEVKDLNYKEGFKSFEKLTYEAEKNKVKIAIENTFNNDIVQMILDEISSKNLGLCYDSSHDWINGNSKGQFIINNSDRLFTTHLSDNDGIADRHWIVGDGTIKWDTFIKTIYSSLSDSTLMLEIIASQEERDKLKPKEYLEKAFYSLKWLESLCKT